MYNRILLCILPTIDGPTKAVHNVRYLKLGTVILQVTFWPQDTVGCELGLSDTFLGYFLCVMFTIAMLTQQLNGDCNTNWPL